ncbi:NAD(P)/FAD-dependent oxidoreductase [Lachnoclostridium sp. Marseille-P6806]|uniref:NAD(P)/FAD-dependent oxidoreductase n=1 Tax=Lachnoclostridium sp. Marseille-P6806 TaxID=2364793 RepID=UPI001F5EC6E2|nr:FAD-dependent oxidoreductase [Lachnoclostridium sp. Marseille-P6806]
MLLLSQLRLECGHAPGALERKLRRTLRLAKSDPLSFRIHRHSLDCRKKPLIFDVYSVVLSLSSAQEKRLLDRKLPGLREYHEKPYSPPVPGQEPLPERPVVVGFGPAGIFAGLILAQHGYQPLILERGKSMEERCRDVERFWKTGELDPGSNIQFGEGGAGTFSDGKLNTLVNDRDGREDFILRAFAEAGAPGDILFESKPHIGTDILRDVIRTLRGRIIRLGGEIRFGAAVTALEEKNGCLSGVVVNGSERIPASAVILAPGHSARDTFEELLREGITMQAKDFAVGFRVAHPQRLIDADQYGTADPEALRAKRLPPSSYKLTERLRSGRGIYSFCMCPGGYVVNASSEPGLLAVNGMSYHGRDSGRANSAIVMTVSAADYGEDSPLAGMAFQRKLERACHELGGGRIPAERFSDFARHTPSPEPLPEELCIKGAFCAAPLDRLLPEPLTEDFLEGMRAFDRRMPGFAGKDAFVIGLESRTSSPVRIPRGETMEASLRGLYPCGEGAGYAGGIMSAAMDGMRIAEAVIRKYAPPQTLFHGGIYEPEIAFPSRRKPRVPQRIKAAEKNCR